MPQAAPERAIVDFRRDGEGHWVAELDCGHPQHVRHDPPLSERPWVVTDAGRRSRLGARLPCRRCLRRELPEDFRPYKRTPEFDADSIPAGLRAKHRTRAGVWARIHVVSGALLYVVEPPLASREVLRPGREGVVVPEIEHRIEPQGPVALFVEFWRRPAGPA